MDITVLSSPDPACDEFVERMPDSKLEHLPAWSFMVERTFGHKSFYLVAREGDSVCGVLPLIYVRSRLFGNRMMSQAFSNYGGPLVESAVASDALCKHAVELAIECGCGSMELRNIEPIPYDFYVHTDKISMYIPMSDDPDKLWKSFNKKIRQQIRKAEENGIVVVRGSELLDDFYRVWTIRMHQLGTPCYPRKLFSSIMKTFPEETQIFVARLNDLTVAVAFVYCFNGRVQLRWTATLTENNRLTPIMLLDWSVMKHYSLAGESLFDFGRCTVGGGTYEFKRRWGAQPIQLHYQYWTQPGHELSLAKPDNPKYSRKVEIWKRLPLWMTRLVGPYISRSLP